MADIGIMGGTFDPIHNGHLMLGKQAYEEYGLDEIWFMPAGYPPHKTDHPVSDAADRCKMVKLAIEEYPYFILSDFEVRRNGSTYTSDTIQMLKKTYPQHCFFFIIGADSLYQMESWYHPKEIMEQMVILVAERKYEAAPCTMEQQIAYLKKRYHADIRRLHCSNMDISSEELRSMEAKGEMLHSYVPKAVKQYIEKHGLYQEKQDGNDK